MPVIPRFVHKLNTGGGVLGFPNPLSQSPGPVVYLNSAVGFGLSGSDGAYLPTWPDKSGNGRDATSKGEFAAQYRSIIANGAAPNGQPMMQFDGFDPPFSQWYSRQADPVSWPSLANGYTFYFLFNLRAANSSTGGEIVFIEEGTGRPQTIAREAAAGRTTCYRDELAVHPSGQVAVTGMQVIREVWTPSVGQSPATGTVTMFRNNVALTFADNTYSLTPSVKSGYAICQAPLALTVGMSAFCGVFCWFPAAHSLALQVLLEDYWRLQFGMSLV